jgi:cytochrome oxidase Cu insertion factor (SCO1/SenC/PrrC family)
LLAIAVAIAVAAVASGCGGSEEEATPVVETVVETETAPIGRPLAPKLTGTTLEGDPISLEDFRGRPVLINVWSSW